MKVFLISLLLLLGAWSGFRLHKSDVLRDLPIPGPLSLVEGVRSSANFWHFEEEELQAIVNVESTNGRNVESAVEPQYIRRCIKLVGEKDALNCAKSLGPGQVMGFYGLTLGIPLDKIKNSPGLNLWLVGHKLDYCRTRFPGVKLLRWRCYNGMGAGPEYSYKVEREYRKLKQKHGAQI